MQIVVRVAMTIVRSNWTEMSKVFSSMLIRRELGDLNPGSNETQWEKRTQAYIPALVSRLAGDGKKSRDDGQPTG